MANELLRLINAYRIRAVFLAWVRGVCLFMAALVATCIVLTLLDGLIRSSMQSTRLLGLLVFLFVSGLALVRWILPVLRYWPDSVQIARRIQIVDVGWHDELATSVQIANGSIQNGRGLDSLTGKKIGRLEHELVQRSHDRLSSLSPQSVLSVRTLVAPLTWLILSLLFAGVSISVLHSNVGFSVKRIAFPWIDADWPRTNQLELVGTIPKEIGRGQTLTVRVRDKHNKLKGAVLESETNSGTIRSLPLRASNSEQGIFEVAIANIQHSQRIRVVGGDDQTDWYQISVVDLPGLLSQSISWVHPDFNRGRPNAVVDSFACWPEAIVDFNGVSDLPISMANLILKSDQGTWQQEMLINDVGLRFRLTFDTSSLLTELSSNRPPVTRDWIKGSVQLTGRDSQRTIEIPVFRFRFLVDQAPKTRVSSTDFIAGIDSQIGLLLEIRDELPLSLGQLTVERKFQEGDDTINETMAQFPIDLSLGDRQTTESEQFVWQGDHVLDLQRFPNLQIGDQVLLSIDGKDKGGNQSYNEPAVVRVVSFDRLVEMVNQKTDELGRLLETLRVRQFSINARSSKAGRAGGADWTRIVNQMLRQQRSLLNGITGDGPGSALQLTRQIKNFASQHRLGWGGQQSLADAAQFLQQIESKLQPTLLQQMAQIEQQLRVSGVAARDQMPLKGLIEIQDEMLVLIQQAEQRINTSITIDRIVQQLVSLVEDQTSLLRDTARLQNQVLADVGMDLTDELERLAFRQIRLRARLDQTLQRSQQLQAKISQTGPAEDGELASLRVIAKKASGGRVLEAMRESENRLNQRRPGQSGEIQQGIIEQLGMMIDELLNQSRDESVLSGDGKDLVNSIADVSRQLSELGEQIKPFVDGQKQMSNSARGQLNQQRKSVRQQMKALSQSMRGSPFVDQSLVDETVQKAIQDLDDIDPGTNLQEIRQESKSYQSAIRNLQSAAIELSSQSFNQSDESPDLPAILEFLTRLTETQSAINRWTRESLDEPEQITKEMDSVLRLQIQVKTGVELLAEGLKKYASAASLVNSIDRAIKKSMDRLQQGLVDSTTRIAQQEAIRMMGQLRTAIEIQTRNQNEPTEIQNGQNDRQQNGQASRISPFELTMLYVMQQGIQADTRQLMLDLDDGTLASGLLERRRIQIADRQAELARVLGQLLGEQVDSIPELPDF